VDSVIAGAVDQAFEFINGSGPLPTGMITARADQVRFICERAGRILSQREIEVLLRITGASARAVVTTMNATYAEALGKKRLEWMRQDATVSASGTDEAGLSWTLRFTEGSTLETAWTELQRIRVAGESEKDDQELALTFPQQPVINGVAIDVLEKLGLQRPNRGRRRDGR
jgi:hypothetical protein